MLNLTLPPGSTPTIQPYGRVSGTAVGSPISGTVVSGRSNLFRFDVSALADGDYVVDLASPSGRFLLRILGDVESLAEEWWQLDAADDIAAVAALGSIGTGARTVAITVNLDGDALQGATVRVTKAAETYLTTTNSSGVATFNLDDGTWVVSITASGAYFNGASLVVNGAEAVTYSMTANATIEASDPDKVTGYWLCLSHLGVAEAGATISMQVASLPSASAGLALDSSVRTAISDSEGVAQFANLILGVRYAIWRGQGQKYFVTIPTNATSPLELNSIIGNP